MIGATRAKLPPKSRHERSFWGWARRLRSFGSLWLALSAVGCGPGRGTIGAVLSQAPDNRLIVREVPDGLAADRAGVRLGDEVLLIDGRDVRRMSAREVHGVLSGEVGESVKLTLIRDGQVVRVRLNRTAAERIRKKPPDEAPAAGAGKADE